MAGRNVFYSTAGQRKGFCSFNFETKAAVMNVSLSGVKPWFAGE